MDDTKRFVIADAHAHIFPEKIAQKAADSIADFYKMQAGDLGTAEVLLKTGTENGVSHFLVCSVATTPRQVPSINQFILDATTAHPEFIGLGSIHPGMSEYEMEAEAENIKNSGLVGVKLHPDIQDFIMDDPKMIPLYKVCAKLGLAILFHCGDSRYDRSSPRRVASVLDQVPDLVAIAAHFGGYSQWDEAYTILKQYPQLFFDTSSSLHAVGADDAMRFIEGYGPARLMFGTDYPLWSVADEMRRFMALPLTDEVRQQIFFGTFSALFGTFIKDCT